MARFFLEISKSVHWLCFPPFIGIFFSSFLDSLWRLVIVFLPCVLSPFSVSFSGFFHVSGCSIVLLCIAEGSFPLLPRVTEIEFFWGTLHRA